MTLDEIEALAKRRAKLLGEWLDEWPMDETSWRQAEITAQEIARLCREGHYRWQHAQARDAAPAGVAVVSEARRELERFKASGAVRPRGSLPPSSFPSSSSVPERPAKAAPAGDLTAFGYGSGPPGGRG